MNLFSSETQATINTKGVTAKTYDAKVKAVGFGTFVKSLGGVFAECYGSIGTQATTIEEFRKRAEYVCGLMAVFKFCYFNGKNWWYWMNSSSKAFYTTKQTNKGYGNGTIHQLCQGLNGKGRITCCNYGVDCMLRALGIYSLTKKTVKTKSKLVPGDVVDLYRKSDGKWHHQVMVYAIEGSKIWCLDFGNRFIKTGKPLHYMSLTGSTAGGEYGTDKWVGRHRVTFKKTTAAPTAVPAATTKKEEDIPVPRTVKKGNTGKAVIVVQTIIGGLKLDGKFGAKTEAAVKKFQKLKGLTVDGVVGPKTWRALLISIQ